MLKSNKERGGQRKIEEKKYGRGGSTAEDAESECMPKNKEEKKVGRARREKWTDCRSREFSKEEEQGKRKGWNNAQ